MSNILMTGRSGFLGRHIAADLIESGCSLSSVGRNFDDDFRADLTDKLDLRGEFDVVIHCAGKAHSVPRSDLEIQEFQEVNVNGTKNLLEALSLSGILPKSFVFISTVAVYGILSGQNISEDESLLATDPYGKSKIDAEKIVSEWCKLNKVVCTILRLPLIAGLNPPGNLGAMIAGVRKGYYFDIAGGKAKKSIVLAKDVASIILKISEIGGVYNLTDRSHPEFNQLSALISNQLRRPKPLNIPKWMALGMAKVGDFIGSKAPINSDKLKKIMADLTFNDQKAVDAFGWNPTPVLKGFKIK